MKILMVIGQFAPVVGGSERQCLALSRALVARGHAVRVLCLRTHRASATHETIDGVEIVRVWFPLWRPFGVGVGFGWMTPLLLRWAMRSQARWADVIHAHGAHWTAGVAARVAQRTHKPLVCKLANAGTRFDFTMLRRRAGGRRAARRLMRQCARFVATSAAVADDLRREGIADDRIAQIPNGVEMPPRSHRAMHDSCTAVFVGTLTPKKNLETLVRACVLLSLEIRARLSVHLVGDGEMMGELKAQVHSAGLADTVRLVGMTDDVSAWLAQADVFVLPSHTEGMSNAALEAMAHGLPLLLSRAGGNTDLVENNGRLVDPLDVDGWCKALTWMVEHPEERRAMGEASRLRAERMFSLERVTKAYEQLYDAVSHGSMRIAHLLTYLDSQTGGMERQALQLAKRLRVRGHEPWFITCAYTTTMRERGLTWRDTIESLRVYRIPLVPRWRRLNVALYVFGSIALMVVRRRHIDVIHAHQLYTSGVVAALAKTVMPSTRLVVKNCCGGEGGDVERLGHLLFHAAIVRFLRTRIDICIALSEETRREMASAGFPRIISIPNGVDIERFAPSSQRDPGHIRERSHVEPSVPLILCMSKFAEHKDIPVLLEAMSMLTMPAHLLLVGTGALQPHLEQLVRDRGLASRVTCCGTTDRAEDFYAAADVFVLPSRAEGMPNVLLEAMSSGCIVVGSDIESIASIISDRTNGYLFPVGDAVALADVLTEALRGASEGMRAAARATTREAYGFPRVVDAYDKLYQMQVDPWTSHRETGLEPPPTGMRCDVLERGKTADVREVH